MFPLHQAREFRALPTFFSDCSYRPQHYLPKPFILGGKFLPDIKSAKKLAKLNFCDQS